MITHQSFIDSSDCIKYAIGSSNSNKMKQMKIQALVAEETGLLMINRLQTKSSFYDQSKFLSFLNTNQGISIETSKIILLKSQTTKT